MFKNLLVICFFLFLLGFISQAANLGTQGGPICRVFSLEDLMEATNNFDSSTFMGEGCNGKVLLKNPNMFGKFNGLGSVKLIFFGFF